MGVDGSLFLCNNLPDVSVLALDPSLGAVSGVWWGLSGGLITSEAIDFISISIKAARG